MKTKTFREYVLELDGRRNADGTPVNEDDRALIDLMFYQVSRVYEESGAPVSVTMRKYEKDGHWLRIYAKCGERYKLYEFATKPVFPEYIDSPYADSYGQVVMSEYRETPCVTRDELSKVKGCIESATRGEFTTDFFYPEDKREFVADIFSGNKIPVEVHDTKEAIEGIFSLWKKADVKQLA